MRMPNGYSIHKMTGRRHNPWRVRATKGYVFVNKETGFEEIPPKDADMSGYFIRQKYTNIGYFKTRTEAQQYMNVYEEKADSKAATFEELYEKWYAEKEVKLSTSRLNSLRSAHSNLEQILNADVALIDLSMMQGIIDRAQKGRKMLEDMKSVLYGVMEYAYLHEYIPIERLQCIKYINFNRQAEEKKNPHVPFTEEEIRLVWSCKGEYIPDLMLMLLYTGTRISELLELKSENVNIEERYFEVTKAKTKAGIRRVPICDRILPFFEERMCNQYIMDYGNGKPLYKNVKYCKWNIWGKAHEINHNPHDTRHTFISNLANLGTDERIIKAIVGHSDNGNVTSIYTHIEFSVLIAAVNKLK